MNILSVIGNERLDISDDRIVEGIKDDMMMSRDKYGSSIHVSKVRSVSAVY